MKRITYGMFGIVERYTAFAFGKANFRVVFEGGSISGSGIIPAKFTTTNPITQQAIQNSKLFKDGSVVVVKSENIDDESQETFTVSKKTKEKESKDYPEVTNGQMARAILSVDPYDVPLAKLSTNANMKEVAAELNITFSNWN